MTQLTVEYFFSKKITKINIILFRILLFLKVTAHIFMRYLLLPFFWPKSFNFFLGLHASLFGTKMVKLSPLISYKQPEELFPDILTIPIKTIGLFNSFRIGGVSPDMGYLITAYELQILCAFIKKTNPEKIFEIGTYRGWTTANMALNASSKCQTMTLDVEPLHLNNPEVKDIFNTHSIKFIQADSTQFDFSPFYGTIDFIFIDGSHAEADLEKDTETALKMLSPQGLIVWHDYNHKFLEVINPLHKISNQIKIYHIPGTALAVHDRGRQI